MIVKEIFIEDREYREEISFEDMLFEITAFSISSIRNYPNKLIKISKFKQTLILDFENERRIVYNMNIRDYKKLNEKLSHCL